MRKKVKYNLGGPVPSDTSLARNLLDQFGTQAVGALEQNANVVNTQEFDRLGAAVNKTKQVANLVKKAAGKKGAEALAKFNTTGVGSKLAEVAGSKFGTFLSSGAGAATSAGLGLLGKKIQQWDQKDGNYSKAGAMGGGALQGAAIGSALGPLGMAAGAGIGAVVGAAQKEKFDAQARYQEVVDFANEGAAEASQRLAKRAILNTFPIEGMKEQVYAQGGQHDPPATRQDSLDVYNNAVALEQALQAQGYDIFRNSFPTVGEWEGATKEEKENFANNVKEFYGESFGDQKYKDDYDAWVASGEWKKYGTDKPPSYNWWMGRNTIEPIDENRVRTREMSASQLNMDLPPQLLDRRIAPQGFAIGHKYIPDFKPEDHNFARGYTDPTDEKKLEYHVDSPYFDTDYFLTQHGRKVFASTREEAEKELQRLKEMSEGMDDPFVQQDAFIESEQTHEIDDLVSFPYYDPLMVKPYDMLTDKEKKERAKKERKTITKILAKDAGPGYYEEDSSEPQGRVLDISEYTDEQRAAYDKYTYENFPFSDFNIHEFVAKNYPDWKPAPLVPKPDPAPEPLPHRLPQSPTPELVTSKAKRTGPKLVGEDEYYIDPMRARSAAGFRGGYQDEKYATGVRRTYENPDGTRFTRTEPYDAEHIEINRQNALDPERFKASASFAHGGEHDPLAPLTATSESTAQPLSAAEMAFLNQPAEQLILPPTISQGNFDVDEEGNIVEENASTLDMLANPMATLRTVVDPSVEGLPTEAELERAKSKGTVAGSFANDMVNPAAWLNYGVNAVGSLGNAASAAVQGEGVQALGYLGQAGLDALGAAPGIPGARAVTNTALKYGRNPYLLNANRANPYGFKNVGDKPHWWRGYEKPIDPARIDMSAGFPKFTQDLYDAANQAGNKFWKAKGKESKELFGTGMQARRNPAAKQHFDDALKEADNVRDAARSEFIQTNAPFIGKQIGRGGFGRVYQFADNPDLALKIGKSEGYYGNNVSDGLMDAVAPFRNRGNIAAPLNKSTFTYLDPNFRKSTMEAYTMRNLNSPGNATQEFANLSARDAQALRIRTARQLRDRGIRLDFSGDAGNIASSNVSPNVTNFFDLHYDPSVAQDASYLAKQYLPIRAYGGHTNNPDYLAEGGEMIQHAPGDLPKTDHNGSVTPITATLARINGDKHSAPSGGVGMEGDKSARIYSDQLHVSDELLAQLSRL